MKLTERQWAALAQAASDLWTAMEGAGFDVWHRDVLLKFLREEGEQGPESALERARRVMGIETVEDKHESTD